MLLVVNGTSNSISINCFCKKLVGIFILKKSCDVFISVVFAAIVWAIKTGFPVVPLIESYCLSSVDVTTL